VTVDQAPAPEQPAPSEPAAKAQGDSRSLLREIAESTAVVIILAVVASLVLSGILILFADPEFRTALQYFFSRPADTFQAAADALGSAYSAIWQGAVYNGGGDTFSQKIAPFMQTLTSATPLIFAGLGIGIGFRAGMFNIGAQGQIMIGATVGAMVGFMWHLPFPLHLILAIVGCALGGAGWGFIPGWLKAKTGAHEVISTIMLNYVALYLLSWLLTLEAFQRPGSNNPQSPVLDKSAQYPTLFGSQFQLHWGFVLALVAAFFAWWLMERSTLGFQFRAVGANASAAKTAGMKVPLVIILVMTVSGALSGLAASAQILGTQPSLTIGIAGSIGFDAITVALLGASRPVGIVLAATLFGGLKAAGPTLQVQADLPIDIVLVIQSLIVLFIAAPPLVRFLFRLPTPRKVKEVVA
jgi:simple sugar transport system permease protein